MNMTLVQKNSAKCVVVKGAVPELTDVQSALDILMTANYEYGTKNLAIQKECIAEEFFVLSSGLAGEVLQKFVNYGGRIAIFGDFSNYTSKPLHDFMLESNQGNQVFFLSSEEEAVLALTK